MGAQTASGGQTSIGVGQAGFWGANGFRGDAFVYILADGNPAPRVAKFMFTPSAGICSATTRMRLAKTQNVYLLAEFSNGSYAMAQSTVKVTIGGCGG